MQKPATEEGNGQQLGALDLGSNSFHLLIAQESHGRIQVLDKYKEMVRLAEDLHGTSTLAPVVVERALACLERFAQRLRPLQPQYVRVVGTDVLRKANDTNFLRQAEDILGHNIDIISGREEARLIYLGVCHDLGGEETRRLVIDIGGGSTELILGRRFTPQTLESLHLGCVSMSQRHFSKGKITKLNMRAAINEALIELEPIAQEFIAQGWESSVGASGTINAVQNVIAQAHGEDQITREGLAEIRSQMIACGELEKLQMNGLSDERKAVFPGGVAVLSAIFEALNLSRITCAQSALREGLIYDLLGRQHADDVRDHTVTSLMQRYRIDQVHAGQVRETAIALLSQVAMAWQLSNPEHKLSVAWAASLHELGMDIAHSGYHKHGGYLLEHMDMPGFSRGEQKQLACLVRAHRRKLSEDLFNEQQVHVMRLAVLLRLATVLHRSRSHDPLPHVEAWAKDDTLSLSLPGHWLQAHPLTAQDLNNETTYLESIGIGLHVVTR